jgi:hypothetical protein
LLFFSKFVMSIRDGRYGCSPLWASRNLTISLKCPPAAAQLVYFKTCKMARRGIGSGNTSTSNKFLSSPERLYGSEAHKTNYPPYYYSPSDQVKNVRSYASIPAVCLHGTFLNSAHTPLHTSHDIYPTRSEHLLRKSMSARRA